MKIAHLILVHKNPSQLERLIANLRHSSVTFFIHIDKKTELQPFEYLLQQTDVFFIKKRINVQWAGYGTIQATLNGMQEIIPQNFDYINVISGQDFPIKSPHYIYNYFQNGKGSEFITCLSIEDEWKIAAPRVKKYHFINWNIPGKFRLGLILSSLLPERKFPLPFTIVGRSNWFALTREACIYILSFLEKNPAVIRFFKYCWGADEFIFATILFNSSFRPCIKESLTYDDWEGQDKGHPKILGIEDLEKLIQSPKLFARKLELDYSERLFDALEKRIHQQS
jgi:hypothetical protein